MLKSVMLALVLVGAVSASVAMPEQKAHAVMALEIVDSSYYPVMIGGVCHIAVWNIMSDGSMVPAPIPGGGGANGNLIQQGSSVTVSGCYSWAAQLNAMAPE